MGEQRVILGLDPSATAIGWARVQIDPEERTLRWGVIRPKARKGEDGADPWGRLTGAAASVAELLRAEAEGVDEIVVEVPGIRPGGSHKTPAKAMAIYGAAVGMVWTLAVGCGVPIVMACPADVWTRWSLYGWPKPRRAAMLSRIDVGRGYDGVGDKGLDGADAILLAWTVGRRTRLEGMFGAPDDCGASVGWTVVCARLDGGGVANSAQGSGSAPGALSVTPPRSDRKRQQATGSPTLKRRR